MKLLRKLFFDLKMTWPRVIMYAVAAALLTFAALTVPGIKDTSIANIGVTFECWVLFALIVILNCNKPLEAGLKCFVFFLISQPLIYLLQVPFSYDGWAIFKYYPYWFIWTVLCFPGGMIAWYVKRDNVPSALILSVATTALAFLALWYFRNLLSTFPKGLIATVFTAALAVLLIFILLKNVKNRLIAGAITLTAAIVITVFLFVINPGGTRERYVFDLDESSSWSEYESNGDYIGTVSVSDNTVVIDAEYYGTEHVSVINEDGEVITLIITYDRKNGVTVTPVE